MLTQQLVMGMPRPVRIGKCRKAGCDNTFQTVSRQRRYCDIHLQNKVIAYHCNNCHQSLRGEK